MTREVLGKGEKVSISPWGKGRGGWPRLSPSVIQSSALWDQGSSISDKKLSLKRR